MTNQKVREPLFQVSKRGEMPLWKAIVIRSVAIIGVFVLSSVICALILDGNPIEAFVSLFEGTFKTKNKIWNALREMSLLLLVGLALLPAFKMKFWNLGGNGQILMGALVTAAIMRGDLAVSNSALANVLMLVCAILAGAVWAVIPAIFKAFFRTNESLFTLMMNYIAAGLVSYFVLTWSYPETSLGKLQTGALPTIVDGSNAFEKTFLTLMCATIAVVLMCFYIKHSKHGYEISVVGESQKTASYAGMNTKKIMIRTVALSGAICGLVGLLLTGSTEKTLYKTIADNRGFTAIMVAWIAKFDPLMMIATAFYVVFMTKGMGQVQMDFHATNSDATNMLVAFGYFIIIACEFFIVYKVKFRGKKAKQVGDFISPQVDAQDEQPKEEE